MSPASQFCVIGAGGHAKVIIQLIRALGHRVVAVVDDAAEKHGQVVAGVPVIGPCDELAALPRHPTVIAVGDNRTRQQIAARFDLDWAVLIHPSAIVDETVQIGPGTVVMAGCVVQVDTRIGSHCVVNTAATIDHDCALGDFVHIAPGAHLAGHCAVDEGGFLGIGATMNPSTRVGRWSTAGAGAAVVNDLPERVVAVGVPAKVVRRRW